ncbi:unnamed protein product [Knipowitschia caucasica]|uniref:Uncharacterized protein n=1 Tax=Knipowitschia caucasica TaxID=637954 RepID=A0AAV2JE34_KNICA
MSEALCRRHKASFYNGFLWLANNQSSPDCFCADANDPDAKETSIAASLSSHLAVSMSDLSTICNIRAVSELK